MTFHPVASLSLHIAEISQGIDCSGGSSYLERAALEPGDGGGLQAFDDRGNAFAVFDINSVHCLC